jgi:hypothetical protein
MSAPSRKPAIALQDSHRLLQQPNRGYRYKAKCRFGPARCYLAYVRPSHLLQGCFDTSPRFGFFLFTLLLEVSSLLGGLNDCHLAMGFKQLSGIVMNVDLTHPHDAVLLSLENKLTYTDQHRCSDFRFHGANTAHFSFASMIVAVSDCLAKSLSSAICLPYIANADFLIISIWAGSWKNGICS